jgi:hypothetical protein
LLSCTIVCCRYKYDVQDGDAEEMLEGAPQGTFMVRYHPTHTHTHTHSHTHTHTHTHTRARALSTLSRSPGGFCELVVSLRTAGIFVLCFGYLLVFGRRWIQFEGLKGLTLE